MTSRFRTRVAGFCGWLMRCHSFSGQPVHGSDIRFGGYVRFVGPEERFGHGVIVTYPGSPDRLPYPVFDEGRSEAGRGVVAAAVGVEDRVVGECHVACGHADGLDDERCLVVVVHRVADDFLGMAVDDSGQVQPPFPRRDICDVSDHFLAWSVGGEVAVDQVGDRPGAAVVLGQAGPPRPRLAWHQAQLTRQLRAVGLLERLADLDRQSLELDRFTSSRRHILTIDGASLFFPAKPSAYSASMNSNLSLNDDPWRSMPLLFRNAGSICSSGSPARAAEPRRLVHGQCWLLAGVVTLIGTHVTSRSPTSRLPPDTQE